MKMIVKRQMCECECTRGQPKIYYDKAMKRDMLDVYG